MTEEHKPQRLRELIVKLGHEPLAEIPDVAEALESEALEILVALEEQLEAERKAWRKALDSALQYVPLKDHDFIEAIVSNPEGTRVSGSSPHSELLADARRQLDAGWSIGSETGKVYMRLALDLEEQNETLRAALEIAPRHPTPEGRALISAALGLHPLCGDPCPEAPDLLPCQLPEGHGGEWHRNRSSSWPVSFPASVYAEIVEPPKTDSDVCHNDAHSPAIIPAGASGREVDGEKQSPDPSEVRTAAGSASHSSRSETPDPAKRDADA